MTEEPIQPENRVTVAVFPDFASADLAVGTLHGAGFPKRAISVVCPRDAVPESAGTAADDARHVEPAGEHTLPAVAVGGAIGTVLGGLTAAATVVASGGTVLLVAGPLLGSAVASGIAGGFIGAMTTRGIEPEIADFYDQSLREGQVLVAVELAEEDAASRFEEAERILAEAGAKPIDLRRD